LKLHDKLLIFSFIASLIVVVVFELIAKDAQEWFRGGSEVASILVNLSLSCAAGCIIYYISAYIPTRQEEKKRADDQVKIDEITSVRLKKVLDGFSRILIVAHNDISSYQEIMALPISEESFIKLTSSVRASDYAVISTSSKLSGNTARPSMTIAEFISEEIEGIKVESEKILRLEKYISSDLIKMLSDLEDVPIVNNWRVLIDDKPMLINGVKYVAPMGPISNYFSYFKALDDVYKRFQQYMYKYVSTKAGHQYCTELDNYHKARREQNIT